MTPAVINPKGLTRQSSEAPRKKILYICHNHPSVMPGGAEVYGLELYEAMRSSNEFEPLFLARRGPSAGNVFHPGTRLSAASDDKGQYFFLTYSSGFDSFFMTLREKNLYTRDLREFLLTYQPAIIHIQHTLFFGYDLLRLIKITLPNTPIVYTLHEYIPICHRNGQMLRNVNDDENCLESSPRRCHECFPEIPAQEFFMRKRFIQSHLSVVDLFLAPSRFLLERYVDWGIPREKIRFEDNGRVMNQINKTVEEERPRTRLGFFGQITMYKGVDVLLKAMKLLENGTVQCDAHLWLHGANLEHQSQEFQEEISRLLAETKQTVTMVGRYQPADLPSLMSNIDWVVVPSIWWENAPLVIQEAFHNYRPIICSDIGGMAEKVLDGINGLHFRTRDPFSLAQVIRQATTSQGTWETLRQGIPEVYRMQDHIESLSGIYRGLISKKERIGSTHVL